MTEPLVLRRSSWLSLERRTASLAALTLVLVATSARADDAPPGTIDYVVKPGDTCSSVAHSVYGADPKAVDTLHASNPNLGPVPHHLVPGSHLRLPPLPPDAKVTFIRNDVEARTPEVHPARVDESLRRGNRVDTLANSSAELLFANETRLQLEEHTLVVILGGAAQDAKPTANAADTTLLTGALSAHLADLARPAMPLATASGARVLVGGGDSLVSVDDQQTTRVAVHRGRSSIVASGRTVAINDGYGSKAEKRKPPTPPRPLPSAPTWSAAPPALAMIASGTADVAGAYAAGPPVAGADPATWHVQVARDERFNDLVVDAKVPATVTALAAKGLAPGSYFARVSAIDGDKFEGKPSGVARWDVVAAAVQHKAGQLGSITVPATLFCGVDGAPLAPATQPLSVSVARPHVLRCSMSADGHDAREVNIPAEHLGVVKAHASLHDVHGAERRAQVTVVLTDDQDAPVAGVTPAVTASGQARVGALVESTTTPGTYEAPVEWPVGTSSFAIRVGIDGVFEAETNAVVPPAPPVVAAPPVERPRGPRQPAVDGALFGGIGVAGDGLGIGGAVGAEAALRWTLSGWMPAVGLRARYERYGAPEIAGCAPSGLTIAGACGPNGAHGSYGFDLTEDVFSVGLPLRATFGAPTARVLPYLGLEPSLIVDRSSVSATVGSLDVESADTAARFGAAAFGGVELRATDEGRFFFEAAARTSPSDPRTWGDSHLSTVLLVAGWRGGL